MRHLILAAALLSSLFVSAQKSYYVTSAGSDDHDGSFEQPWKTTAPANLFDFSPGDSLLFWGGQLFGKLDLQPDDEGLSVSSYNGLATLGGLYAYNVGNISISNLTFSGPGAAGNNESGIFFYMDSLAASDCNNILIDAVTVTRFGETGVMFGAQYTANGYNNVKVLNSSLNNNGKGGFASYGHNSLYNHSNFYLYKVAAYQNYGRTDITYTHTGSGIIVGNVEGALVEYCEAYENGKYNRSTIGGPQGIWCVNAKNTTIQYCVSYNNRAGRTYDGGGFDIDGGSQNCIIQYCYSYGNDGPGYAMFDHGSANQFTNNTIRYNISQNDARRNYHGALTFWASLSTNKIKNSHIYNNTFYLPPSSVGTPVAIYYKGSNVVDLNVYNNIFYTTDTVKIVKGTSAGTVYSNNNYYNPDYAVNFKTGGVSVDPHFVNAGGGKEGYKLTLASPMINAGKASPATVDFAGSPVPFNGGYDIGAYEYNSTVLPTVNAGADVNIKLPVHSALLSGTVVENGATITRYNWTHLSGPATPSIETAAANTTTVSNLLEGTYTFRLTVTTSDGATAFDDVQVLVAPAPPPSGKRSINVNLFGGVNPYNNSEWNNWNVTASLNSGKLKYADTSISLISAAITKNTISDNGTTYGGGMAPAEVLRFTSNASVSRTLTFSGLSTDASYNMDLFASRNNTGNSTVFTINGTSVTVLTDKNLANKASFTNLKATAAGQLTVSIQNTNSYNYLNGFTLEETGPGTPTASAGSDKTITLPTNTATLNGGGTDEGGSIVQFSWSKIAGPETFAFGSPEAAITTVTNLTAGTYTFRLTVTDNDGATAFDDVAVVVNAALPPEGTKYVKVNLFGGTNPYANAEWNNWNVSGSLNSGILNYSTSTASPISAVISKHTLSDNGSTYGGGMAPPEVLRYSSYTNTARTLTFSGLSTTKTYNLELYASRNNTGNSTVFAINGTSVTVLTDKNLTVKASFVDLSPSAQGQLVISISNLNSYNYLNGFILTEKAPPAGTPSVNAGADQTITLPQNSAVLTGDAKDENGSIESFTWSKVSGPAAYTIVSPGQASTTVSGLTEGTYVFRLTVTDNEGTTAYDEVSMQVIPEPLTPGTREIKVNLFGGLNPYANAEWNNWNVSASLTIGALKYASGRSSSIGASITKNSIGDNGSTYGGTMAPPQVLRYTSYANVARTLTLSGLTQGATYRIEFYASRSNTGNSTVFTINGLSQTVVTDKNFDTKVVFNGLTATAAGQLVVSLKNGTTYNYLNGFTLTETIGEVTTVAKQNVRTAIKEPTALFGVQAFPNPTNQYTTLSISGSSKPVQIKVLDAFGRVLEIKKDVLPNSNYKIGQNLAPGVYLIEVVQKGQKKTIKLVKTAF